MPELPVLRARLSVLVCAMLLCQAVPARAHKSMPVPLAFWGGFATDVSSCQRMVGTAAALCGRTVWRARDRCLAAQLSGGTCDMTATDGVVSQAHVDALNAVDAQCAGDQPSTLSFASTFEIETDVDTFCQTLETAAVSAVYGPAVRSGIGVDDETVLRCTAAAARASTKLLRFAFSLRCRALDRVASVDLSPTQKTSAITTSTARIAHAQALLRGRLVAICPENDFVSVYGQGTAAFLTLIGKRADCLGGAAYVQDAVLCPAAVCGNGMQEAGEQCDDGNLVDGDGCHHDCTRE